MVRVFRQIMTAKGALYEVRSKLLPPLTVGKMSEFLAAAVTSRPLANALMKLCPMALGRLFQVSDTRHIYTVGLPLNFYISA